MTEWSTVNVPKKFKNKIKKEAVENGDFSSVKEFMIYSARKELESKEFEKRVIKILEENELL